MRRLPLILSLVLALPAGARGQVSVYTVRLDGRADVEAVRLLSRAVDGVARSGAVALVVELGLSDGTLDDALALARRMAQIEFPVYALLEDGAGAPATIAALAVDSTFLAGEARLATGWRRGERPATGAKGEAVQAALRKRGLAEAEARSVALVPNGLGSEAAVARGVAAGSVRDVGDLLQRLNLSGAEVTVVDLSWLTMTVEVTNRNWRDVRVYLIRGGTRQRLGQVTSMNTVRFTLPQRQLVPGAVVHLLAEAIGSRDRVRTEDMRVDPGLVVEWLIANVIIESNYFIYSRP